MHRLYSNIYKGSIKKVIYFNYCGQIPPTPTPTLRYQQSLQMSVPIVFEYDYKMKAQTDIDIDCFEKYTNISTTRTPYGLYIIVEFSSLKDIGYIRNEMTTISDLEKRLLMYDTLDYADEYTGGHYFEFYDKKYKTLSCAYCHNLEKAKIPIGEKLPCCNECLCACSEYTHKGENVSFDKIKVINSGGIFFRVCDACIPEFTREPDDSESDSE